MEKYTVFVAYSLKDNNYTERPNGLKSTHKLFNTPEEAIDAIVADIKEEYDNDNYRGFKLYVPKVKTFSDGDKYVTTGEFTCRYIFGPTVRYDIYINTINMD